MGNSNKKWWRKWLRWLVVAVTATVSLRLLLAGEHQLPLTRLSSEARITSLATAGAAVLVPHTAAELQAAVAAACAHPAGGARLPLGGAAVAVPSGRAVWQQCDPIVRAPAAPDVNLFIESAAARVEVVDGQNLTTVNVAVFHEGPNYGVEGVYHGKQNGDEGIGYWLAGSSSVPCNAVRLTLPDVTVLTCVGATDTDLALPEAHPNAPPWQLRLRWKYGDGGPVYDALINVCAVAVPAMYACPEAEAAAAPPRRVPRLGICVSSLSDPHGTLAPKLVVDFIENYRLLGVHHIAIHMRSDAMSTVGTALAAAYAADAPHFIVEAIPSGNVTAYPANLDRWPYYDQTATLNSCLGHLRGQVDWLGLFDIDEWMVVGNGTTAEPLAASLTRWGCGGDRVHATACNNTPALPVPAPRLSCLLVHRDHVNAPAVAGGVYPGGVTAQQYFTDAKEPAPVRDIPKLWCDPTAVTATWVHHTANVPGAGAVEVPLTAGTFRHFVSYYVARDNKGTPGATDRAADAAFSKRLAAASAARLAHPALVAAAPTATATASPA